MMRAAIIAASLVVAVPVAAHEAPSGWPYPLRCCSNRDCAALDPAWVSPVASGYRITIPAGGHPMARGGWSGVVPYERWEASPDGKFHLCLDWRGEVLCAFAPPPGV